MKVLGLVHLLFHEGLKQITIGTIILSLNIECPAYQLSHQSNIPVPPSLQIHDLPHVMGNTECLWSIPFPLLI